MITSHALKLSKIPVLKKVKVLKPLKSNVTESCSESHFKYCRNCQVLKENLTTCEQNIATLLKENNFLRQQLAILNQSSNLPDQFTQHENCEVTAKPLQTPGKITNTNPVNSNVTIPQPYSLTPGHPFSQFDVNTLDKEITYSHDLSSRKIKFFGDVPYQYSEIVHQPCSIPEDSYLLQITDHVKALFPNFTFNSVLINKYVNGSGYIPMHSDDEKCIRPNSNILTVSLGETRIINFQPKFKSHGSDLSTNLEHGDVFIMSSNSQKLFKHGIPKDCSKSMRISLTFRDLVWPQTETIPSPGALIIEGIPSPTQVETVQEKANIHNLQVPFELGNSQQMQQDTREATAEPVQKVDTLFISSSMFADMDHTKLSSSNHSAAVFFYRGATAGGILNKLQHDPDFNDIDASSIKQVFLLCGTNDVDNILHVQRSNHSNINIDSDNYDEHKFLKTIHDMHNLVNFLHNRNFKARINILNILPRASISRNRVINNLNQYLMNLCNQLERSTFINTEFRINLFSSHDGFRKMPYFKQIGSDNVHLNKEGVVRLGKHLKYLSHLDCPKSNHLK